VHRDAHLHRHANRHEHRLGDRALHWLPHRHAHRHADRHAHEATATGTSAPFGTPSGTPTGIAWKPVVSAQSASPVVTLRAWRIGHASGTESATSSIAHARTPTRHGPPMPHRRYRTTTWCHPGPARTRPEIAVMLSSP
jgi:hypothetical protein